MAMGRSVIHFRIALFVAIGVWPLACKKSEPPANSTSGETVYSTTGPTTRIAKNGHAGDGHAMANGHTTAPEPFVTVDVYFGTDRLKHPENRPRDYFSA